MWAALSPPRVWPHATVVDVHDGDTVTLDVDLGRHVAGHDTDLGFHVRVEAGHLHYVSPVRLYGLNAAELASPAGKVAQEALLAFMPTGSAVWLTTWADRSDKYGRLLGAVVKADGTDVNAWMIAQGYAVAWNGQGPKPIPPPRPVLPG